MTGKKVKRASDESPDRRPPSFIEQLEHQEAGSQELAAGRLAVDVQSTIERAFLRSGIQQQELARRMGISDSRVSQILSSDGNLRVATIAKLLRALGYRASLQALPVDPSMPMLTGSGVRRRRRDELAGKWHVVELANGESWAMQANVTHRSPGVVDINATAALVDVRKTEPMEVQNEGLLGASANRSQEARGAE